MVFRSFSQSIAQLPNKLISKTVFFSFPQQKSVQSRSNRWQKCGAISTCFENFMTARKVLFRNNYFAKHLSLLFTMESELIKKVFLCGLITSNYDIGERSWKYVGDKNGICNHSGFFNKFSRLIPNDFTFRVKSASQSTFFETLSKFFIQLLSEMFNVSNT